MSIFDFFRRNADTGYDGPEMKFGRYSDAFKDEVKHSIYSEAIDNFEQYKNLQSVAHLIEFLRNDLNDNIQYDVEGEELFFELLQGSKRIIGRCNNERFVAISEIAKLKEANIGLFRRLLDKNYLMKYARFCVNSDQEVSLKFDSFMQDASPKKIYNALKELAITADKYDDILVDEFDELGNTNTGKIIELPSHVKKAKINFIKKTIKKTIQQVNNMKGHTEIFHHSVSYKLLYCNYKIDFLTKPEGFIMELIERNHRLFFEKNKKTNAQKNKEILDNFELILERSDEQINEELYDTIHTFGYTKPASHNDLINLIQTEISNATNYFAMKKPEQAIDIMSYIVSYGLFQFGYPQPDIDMLTLMLQILEQDYYNELGFEFNFIENDIPDKQAILKRIYDIQRNNVDLFPEFEPDTNTLRFDNIYIFCHSFLNMLTKYQLHYAGHIS